MCYANSGIWPHMELPTWLKYPPDSTHRGWKLTKKNFGHMARKCKKVMLDHFPALFCIFCHQGIYLWWFQSPKMSFHAKRHKWYFRPQITPMSNRNANHIDVNCILTKCCFSENELSQKFDKQSIHSWAYPQKLSEMSNRLAQVGGNPQSLTCSWILSSKCVYWYSRDIRD